MARSLPGQWTPAPSPTQKMPKLVSMMPTAVLMVFSGTSLSWRDTTSPTTATRTNAAPAASAARPSRCWAAPRLITMSTTSVPSRNTPLKATANAARRRGSRVRRGLDGGRRRATRGIRLAELGHGLGVDLVLVVEGLVPAPAQDGLAQPRQAEHEEQRAHDDA